MAVEPKNIIIFAVLLGAVAHIIIFQDGFWNNFMWFTAALCVVGPVIAYKYLKLHQRKNAKRRRMTADI